LGMPLAELRLKRSIKSKMEALLKEEGPYTVLAPTDEAFEKMGSDFEALKKDPQQLQNVVIGHLFNGKIVAADVEQAKQINITEGDIEAGNGTVHIIDEVLME
ncbi:MAG: fasciclin domain-containing protein, partial [Gracilimonas sp.]